MFRKHILIWVAVFLLMSALVIGLTQFWGLPLNHLIVGIAANILYGVLIGVYLLRFVLVFLGVFAIYRILKQRHNKLFNA